VDGGHRLPLVEPGAGGELLVEPVRPSALRTWATISAGRAGLGSPAPDPGDALDQAFCFATNPPALLVRTPPTNGRAQDKTTMARSAHGTVRGRRLGLAGRRWTAVGNPRSPERRCHMARLRRMLLALAVAVLLLVGTATAALAGLTATGVD
jgi:hypothetical protein